MRTSESLKLLYKLSDEALSLSRELNIQWGFEKKNPFDNSFYIRAAIKEPVTIEPNKLIPISTGLLYVQITEPTYEIFINPYINLLRKENLGIIPSKFDYNHKSELKVLIYNYSNNPSTLIPGDIIGYISVLPIVQVEVENILILEENVRNIKDNSWIEEDRKLINLEKQLNSEYYKDNKDTNPYNQTMINAIIENRLK